MVAAHLPELEGLRKVLGAGLRGQVGALRVAARAVGIGMCASAAGTMAALTEFAPRAVVQVGTCGVYRCSESPAQGERPASALRVGAQGAAVRVEPRGSGCALRVGEHGAAVRVEPRGSGCALRVGEHGAAVRVEPRGSGCALRVGELVVARQVRLVSVAVVQQKGVLPEVMGQACEADRTLTAALAAQLAAPGIAIASADVATTLAITTDAALAQQLAGGGCAVEHLEAFAVLHACELRGVPYGAVLAIANEVGPNAHVQWVEHHRAAGARAAERVCEWIAEGAPGVSGMRLP